MTERARGLVVAGCLTGATLFWAGNYVVGAAAVRELSPVSLTALRWAIAALPLVVIAQLVERPDWRAALRTWRRQLMLAVVGMIGYALLVYSALQHTSSVNASLVNALNPALIALLAAALARSAPSRQAVAGMLLGLAGVLVVLTRGRIETLLSLHVNLGDLLMLGAITVWSIYTVIGRSNAGSVPPITATAIQAVLSAVVMAPFALAGQVHWPRTGSGTMALLFIAVFPSLGAYLLWNLGLRRLPERAAGTAGVYMNLITVFTVAINAVLGYRIGAAQLVGGALVLGGVLLVHRARR
ncbi:DMT family transporter [Cellulomonas denverensis]|uniref:DMT family transporter n=1 Tax=Cellulomonas denverensis TaxID=264297 RepID=A0A7X6R0Q1_9CELL|nr:DMT family transporter [Cellulomonas denverensis]NKY24473.1 DMT family transporter [Cellulomonas denverensis]GIG25390.1 multidrug DMT transporter permease [Cellulomonas denverensis]